MKHKRILDFSKNPYTKQIRLKPSRKKWLELHRDKKNGQTAPAFLDEIIDSHIHIKKLF